MKKPRDRTLPAVLACWLGTMSTLLIFSASGAAHAREYPAVAYNAVDDVTVDPQLQETGQKPIERAADRTTALLMVALSQVGAPYRYGGNLPETGFDCSGFVRHAFAQALALQMPRSAVEMSRLGTSVKPDDLEPGDLLFYNTLKRRFSHVAIYLGDDRFVHAPSRGKQVEIVSMADRYWRKRYNGARRIVAAEVATERVEEHLKMPLPAP